MAQQPLLQTQKNLNAKDFFFKMARNMKHSDALFGIKELLQITIKVKVNWIQEISDTQQNSLN